MSTYILAPQVFYAVDATGAPLAGGKVYTYAAGGSTPQDTYDANGAVNANPVTLNALGQADIRFDPALAYRILVKDAAGVTVTGYPVDNVSVPNTGSSPVTQIVAGTGISLTYTGITAGTGVVTVSLAGHTAALLTSGTVPDARFPATLPALNGSALTALAGANITGIAPTLSVSTVTPVTPAGGTTEKTVQTLTLPAGVLNADGAVVHVQSQGLFKADANNKLLRMYFGSTAIFSSGVVTLNNIPWMLDLFVQRLSATTQRAYGYATFYTGAYSSGGIAFTTPAETLSGTVVIKTTSGSATEDSSEATGYALTVSVVR